jgi:hypothetical protein
VPEIIDPVFAKTSQNARFLLSENERFGLVFVKNGSINSGTDLVVWYEWCEMKMNLMIAAWGCLVPGCLCRPSVPEVEYTDFIQGLWNVPNYERLR